MRKHLLKTLYRITEEKKYFDKILKVRNPVVWMTDYV